MKWILVPVDGSEGAKAAAAFAVDIARGLGAGILLLHVYDAPTAALLGLAHLTHEDMEATKSRIAAGVFDAARLAIGDAGVQVETIVAIGNPGREVVTQAEICDARMVVMGSRGLSFPRDLLLGSVSQHVLHHTRRPVTIVPPVAEGPRR